MARSWGLPVQRFGELQEVAEVVELLVKISHITDKVCSFIDADYIPLMVDRYLGWTLAWGFPLCRCCT